nr:DUF1905 domain-containing protein [Aurantiacibacter rhizosphaerae]
MVFITIAGDAADEIRAHAALRRMETGKSRGFGSVRVEVTLGDSCWTTSVFPRTSHEGYLLPVKATVRKAEGLGEDDGVQVTLSLL